MDGKCTAVRQTDGKIVRLFSRFTVDILFDASFANRLRHAALCSLSHRGLSVIWCDLGRLLPLLICTITVLSELLLLVINCHFLLVSIRSVTFDSTLPKVVTIIHPCTDLICPLYTVMSTLIVFFLTAHLHAPRECEPQSDCQCKPWRYY